MIINYHASSVPNVNLSIPRHVKDNLWTSILVWLDVRAIEFISKMRSSKVAQHWWANALGFLHLPREIDDPSIGFFSRARAIYLGLFECYKRRVVFKAKHDVVRFDV